jgi:HD-GYP domain-containing protein (c-di-GMP phosphodiesterase class II)
MPTDGTESPATEAAAVAKSSPAPLAGSPAPSRVGFLPVPLEQILVRALAGIPVYLQTAQDDEHRFTLYSAEERKFTEFHRRRLQEAGVRLIYLPMEHHTRFREQMETELEAITSDPSVAIQVKTALVYKTSLALIDEVLAEGMEGKMPRLASVAKSVSELVVRQAQSFAHLFATAQHDFYTATHMVNVGTWMTSLAFAMGTSDPGELEGVCTAGMLHDVGKQCVPTGLLNKAQSLANCEWALMRTHPSAGAEHMRRQNVTSEVILRVMEEHHERLDGTGYPRQLKADQIHPVSRVCAVVDSFEAMTSARPYRNHIRSIAESIKILQSESPAKYDATAVETWVRMLQKTSETGMLKEGIDGDPAIGRRSQARFNINCPLTLRELTPCGDAWMEGPPLAGQARNISLGGIGIMLDRSLKMGAYIRVRLLGKGTLKDRVCEGLVLWCRQVEDGALQIGVRFCKPGDQETAARGVAAN